MLILTEMLEVIETIHFLAAFTYKNEK